MKLVRSRVTNAPVLKVLALALVCIIIMSSAAYAAFLILYQTKQAEKHLLFYTDGFQGEHYYITRVDSHDVGWVNISHEVGTVNLNIQFHNIDNFVLNMESLCIDEGTDDLFFANVVSDDYCYRYLDFVNAWSLDIQSNIYPVNLSFINVPNPFEIKFDNVVFTSGNISVDPFDGNWTYDTEAQTFHTRINNNTFTEFGTNTLGIKFNEETTAFLASRSMFKLGSLLMAFLPLLMVGLLIKGLTAGSGVFGGKKRGDRE